MRPYRVTKVPRLPGIVESLAGLYSAKGQIDFDIQKVKEKSSHSPTDLGDSEPTAYVIDKVV